MDYEKNKIQGTLLLLSGIGIIISIIFMYTMSFLYLGFYIFIVISELIFGITLILAGRVVIKPMEKLEENKKIGYISVISGVLIFILPLIGSIIDFEGSLIYQFVLIDVLIFGILLIILGIFNIRPMELERMKKLGYVMVIIGVFMEILFIIRMVRDTILIIITGGTPIIAGILFIKKTTTITTTFIEEVKEETKEWSTDRILLELKDTEKKYQAYKRIGLIIILAGVGCFSTGVIFVPIFRTILYGFIVAGIIIILISVPLFTLYWKGHQKYSVLKDILSQKDEQPIIQTTEYLDELEKLKELLDKDVITKEEFEAKKKQVLGL